MHGPLNIKKGIKLKIKLLQTFQKYLSFKKDNSELLFYILRQMALDQLTYIRCVQGPDAAVVEVSEKDLIDRVSIHCS